MIIPVIKFPIYGLFILLSFIFYILFNFLYLKKQKIKKDYIFLSIFMILSFCIISSKIMTMCINYKENLSLLTAGFTSYGGAIGIIVGAYLFYKISDEKMILKSNILSLPFMYSISKLGCFFAGCCYGIPYQGIFSVTYQNGLDISLFPIQFIESILFFLIFLIGYYFKDKKCSLEILVILSAITKFVLEYFRYDNIGKILCINQMVSLMLVIFASILIIKKVKQNV